MGLFGGDQVTTQENTIDPYVSEQSEWATGRALDISDRPYEAYQGDRVAGLSGAEQRGGALARRNVGSYDPYYNRSRDASRAASADFDPQALGKYQTQYQTNVTDPTLKRLRDKGAANIGRIEAGQKKTSAFGDMGNRREAAFSQIDEGLADAQAMGDYEGFGYASENYARDQANQAKLADRYRQMGDTSSALGALDVNRLMAAGGRERGVEQTQADFDYGQYLEGRDWDQNRLDQLVGTLGGIEYDRTTVSEGPDGSDAGMGLGALAGIAGGLMQGGDSGGWVESGMQQDSPDPGYYQPGGGYDQGSSLSVYAPPTG